MHNNSPDIIAVEGWWRVLRERLEDTEPQCFEDWGALLVRPRRTAKWLHEHRSEDGLALCTNEKQRADDVIDLDGGGGGGGDEVVAAGPRLTLAPPGPWRESLPRRRASGAGPMPETRPFRKQSVRCQSRRAACSTAAWACARRAPLGSAAPPWARAARGAQGLPSARTVNVQSTYSQHYSQR